MDTIVQMVEQDTEPAPEGGPGGRRTKQQGAPDRRISIEDKAMRHGRTSSAKTCNGFQEHVVLDLDSTVTREVVVCPANEPEYAAVELGAEALEGGQDLLQLDIDLGDMARPPLAARWGTLDHARLHPGLCARDGHLSAWPDRADDAREGRPVSGQCV